MHDEEFDWLSGLDAELGLQPLDETPVSGVDGEVGVCPVAPTSESDLGNGCDGEADPEFGQRRAIHPGVEELIQRAMAGAIPRLRELKSWEPDKLNPIHMQIIMLRSTGMKQRRIAEYLGIVESRVSVVLRSPDAQYVLNKLISYAADNVSDMQTRIAAYAPEALDVAVEVMRTSQNAGLRAKTAFEILGLAGYSKTQKVQVSGGVAVAHGSINLLASALRESGLIEEIEYAPASGNGLAPGGDIGEYPESDATSGERSVSEPPTGGSQDQTTQPPAAEERAA